MEVLSQEEIDEMLLEVNDGARILDMEKSDGAYPKKIALRKRRHVFIYCCFVLALFTTVLWAIGTHREAVRKLAESNRLVEQYRDRDAETARINRDLAERNKRLEEGFINIREIAGSAGGNIRQAIGIISGVQSVIKTMEDGGAFGDTGGFSGGDN